MAKLTILVVLIKKYEFFSKNADQKIFNLSGFGQISKNMIITHQVNICKDIMAFKANRPGILSTHLFDLLVLKKTLNKYDINFFQNMSNNEKGKLNRQT